jgi:lipoprotein-releasing system permease protein
MNSQYLGAELIRRPSRTLFAILSITFGVAMFVSLQAFANGYKQAARAPLGEVGSDVAVQRQGNVPDKFEGVVFPHSVSPIHKDEIERIRNLAGVEDVAEVIFFWDFEPDGFVAALGVDPASTFGPGRLQAVIIAGRYLQPGDIGVAIADTTYAQQYGLSLGSAVEIAGSSFHIIGLGDTTLAGQIANANLFIPLDDARRLVNAAPYVKSVHSIFPDDANLLFIKANQLRVETVAGEVKQILGDQGIVTTPRSFGEELGALFSLIDHFGLLVGLATFLFAAGVLIRLTAAGIWERRRDVGLMRAVGWRRREVIGQLWAEILVLVFAGTLLGLALGAASIWLIGQARITIPVPWELSPTPHFLPGGAKAVSVDIPFPAQLTVTLAASALGLSLVTATLVGVWLANRLSKIKPAEVLRSE